MNQSVADLLPYLRELSFVGGFFAGTIVGLLAGLVWKCE